MEATWILRRARKQADRSRGTLLAVAATFLALTISAGGALLGGRLAGDVTGAVADNVHVIAYLRDDMSEERAGALVELLRRIPGVADARPVGSDEALKRLRAAARSLGGAAEPLEGLEPGFLPR